MAEDHGTITVVNLKVDKGRDYTITELQIQNNQVGTKIGLFHLKSNPPPLWKVTINPYFKDTCPLCNLLVKSTTEGVEISYGGCPVGKSI